VILFIAVVFYWHVDIEAFFWVRTSSRAGDLRSVGFSCSSFAHSVATIEYILYLRDFPEEVDAIL
jgi:hypothetical protein